VQWRQNKVASARRELIAQENARAGAEHLRRVIFNDGVITEKRRGCRTGRGGERDIACDYRRTKANRCRWSAGVEDQRPTDRPTTGVDSDKTSATLGTGHLPLRRHLLPAD